MHLFYKLVHYLRLCSSEQRAKIEGESTHKVIVILRIAVKPALGSGLPILDALCNSCFHICY